MEGVNRLITSSGLEVEAWSDAELLGRLLGQRKSRKVFGGSFAALFGSEDQTAIQMCLVAREFVRRWLGEQLHRQSVLTQPSAVREFLKLHFAGQEYESFACLFLDAQLRLITAQELFRGTLSQTSVYPREVVKAALRHNAASVIFAHNHPSGVPEPSIQDQSLTRALAEALALVDVKVMDHMVVAGPNCVSFAERGLI